MISLLWGVAIFLVFLSSTSEVASVETGDEQLSFKKWIYVLTKFSEKISQVCFGAASWKLVLHLRTFFLYCLTFDIQLQDVELARTSLFHDLSVAPFIHTEFAL